MASPGHAAHLDLCKSLARPVLPHLLRPAALTGVLPAAGQSPAKIGNDVGRRARNIRLGPTV